MKAPRTLPIVFVLIVVASALFYIALSQTSLRASTRQSGEMTGACTAVSYFEGDAEEIALSRTTVTSGNGTAYVYTVVSTVSTPTISTVGTSAYSTTSSLNGTFVIVVTSTSLNQAYAPNGAWTVSICTYS